MTGSHLSEPPFRFEAFGTAVALAGVCGVLSTFLSLFLAATATLVALALAGWVSLARQRGTLSPERLGLASVVGLGVLAGAAAAVLVVPAVLLPLRGPILAGGLLPLFAIERRRFPSRPPEFGGR